MSGGWNPKALPDLTGKTILVTGANRGVGFFTSAQLAGAGASVVLACRSQARADAALAAIRGRVPGASVSFLQLDTADLVSVRAAADAINEFERLDGLIENAAMVDPPAVRTVNADRNEIIFATNFLGHFALTAQVLPVLLRTPGARVVALGSMISRMIDLRLDNLQLHKQYSPWRAYAHSKIAVQSFGFELDRRMRAAAADASALVVHPGYSNAGRTQRVPGVHEPGGWERFAGQLQASFTQSKSEGAWPSVRAVADPSARGGEFYGPKYLTRGTPVLQTPTRTSLNPQVAAELWSHAEQATGVEFDLS